MFIKTANDLTYSPLPRAMSCSRFSNATAANRRAFWLSCMTPSALIQDAGLVLDVNLRERVDRGLGGITGRNDKPNARQYQCTDEAFHCDETHENFLVFVSYV